MLTPKVWARLGWRAFFSLVMAVILWLALKPGGGNTDWFWQADKVRHAGAFAVLWCLGWQAWPRAPWRLALALLGFGVFIEIAQAFTPDREASLLDLVADLVGVILGWRCWPITRRLWVAARA